MSRRRGLRLIVSLIVAIGLSLIAHWQQGPANTPDRQVSLTPGFYRVTEFVDGDTIKVDMNGQTQTIRLIGVDTPETHHPDLPVQCFGYAAADYTKSLIGSQPVRLEADPLSSNRDRYDRLLRYVYLPDNTLVNQKLVTDGYGFAYTAFEFSKAVDFTAAQKQAKVQQRGLWAACPADAFSSH